MGYVQILQPAPMAGPALQLSAYRTAVQAASASLLMPVRGVPAPGFPSCRKEPSIAGRVTALTDHLHALFHILDQCRRRDVQGIAEAKQHASSEDVVNQPMQPRPRSSNLKPGSSKRLPVARCAMRCMHPTRSGHAGLRTFGFELGQDRPRPPLMQYSYGICPGLLQDSPS